MFFCVCVVLVINLVSKHKRISRKYTYVVVKIAFFASNSLLLESSILAGELSLEQCRFIMHFTESFTMHAITYKK